MSRLIDADTLFKEVTEGRYTTGNIFKDMELQQFIKEQPTAFDAEMVVEQLMIIHDEGYCPNEDGLECVLNKACSDCYREKIIDIVKKGGVE